MVGAASSVAVLITIMMRSSLIASQNERMVRRG